MEYWPELGYTICIATIKISVLISYNIIFGRLKWFRYIVFTLATLTIIWFLGVFFSVLFQCTPVDKAWQPTKLGHCIAFKPFLWGNSISNTILDWLILLLPVAPVLKLQMGTVQKTLVLASFSLGSLYVSFPRVATLNLLHFTNTRRASVSSTLRAAQTRTVDEANLSGQYLPNPLLH